MDENKESQSEGWALYDALMAMEEVNNNLANLLRWADKDPDIRQRCLDPDLDEVWEEAWSRMNALPTFEEAQADKNLSYRPLKKQPHLHPFYRVAGLYFFHCGSNPGQRELLIKAAQPPYFNFQALRTLAQLKIAELSRDKFADEFALIYASQAARVHHAPGFILLAETQFDLGCHYRESDPDRSLAAFTCALKNMMIADRLQSHCANSLYNAYSGLGVTLRFDDGTELGSIADRLTQMQQYLQRNRCEVNAQLTTHQAMTEAKTIIEKFYPEPAEKQPLFKRHRHSLV